MKTKFKIGDCVEFHANNSTEVGIVKFIHPCVPRRARAIAYIRCGDKQYHRYENEIYPITKEQFILKKLEN